MKLQKGDKAGIMRCSNPHQKQNKERLRALYGCLREIGLEPVECSCIYEGTAAERAAELMTFYKDPEIRVIFDISGGDMANEILPFLDFDLIAKSGKSFWGYSDLTTVINAIYAKTGRPSMLYQIRNLVGWGAGNVTADEAAALQKKRLQELLKGNDSELTGISYRMICGTEEGWKESIVVGGNIRCLLKLAGTPYWPDMQGKLLLLESFGGREPQMRTLLNQLKQMGVFDQIAGVLLGTFSILDEEYGSRKIEELVLEVTEGKIPAARTGEIGHGIDAKGIWIGKPFGICRNI